MLWIRRLALASPSRARRDMSTGQRASRCRQWSMASRTSPAPSATAPLCASWPSAPAPELSSCILSILPASAQGGPGRGGDLGIGAIPEGPPPSKTINNNSDPSGSQDVLNVLSGVSPEGSKWRQVVGQEAFFFITFFPVRVSRLSPGSVQTKTGWPWVRRCARELLFQIQPLPCIYPVHTRVRADTRG